MVSCRYQITSGPEWDINPRYGNAHVSIVESAVYCTCVVYCMGNTTQSKAALITAGVSAESIVSCSTTNFNWIT